MNRQRLRALFGRVLAIESADRRRIDWDEWRLRRNAEQDRLLQKLKDIVARPTPPKALRAIVEIVEEERDHFEARKAAYRGPKGFVLDHLNRIAQYPDARRFQTAEAFAQAVGAWHEKTRAENARGELPLQTALERAAAARALEEPTPGAEDASATPEVEP